MLALAAALYVLVHPELLSSRVFISENALSYAHQTHDFTDDMSLPWNAAVDRETLLTYYFNIPEVTGHYSVKVPGTRVMQPESLVMAFPISDLRVANIRLAGTLYRYLLTGPQWLAKDVVIVLYEEAPYAAHFRAWLASSLYKFGTVRAAFVFDIEDQFDLITVESDGLNGTQVDIDMLIAVVRALEQGRGFTIEYPNVTTHISHFPGMKHALSSWVSVLQGHPHQAHSYLLDVGILAVTIRSVSGHKTSLQTVKTSLVKAMEKILRMFGALDEQLHAGYYFYFFTSPLEFVPLSKFAYIVLALGLPLILQSILACLNTELTKKPILMTVWTYAIGVTCLAIPPGLLAAGLVAGLTALPKLLGVKHDVDQTKAAFNITLAFSMSVLSLFFPPLAFAAGILLVPVRLFVRPFKPRLMGTLCLAVGVSGLAILCYLSIGLHDLQERSGHCLYTVFSLALVPQAVQTLYLIS